MAIQNDDWDIRKTWLYTEVGGNGDYYVTIVTEMADGSLRSNNIRVTTSGSRYPSSVMLAVANLHKVLEAAGLNGRELSKELQFMDKLPEPGHEAFLQEVSRHIDYAEKTGNPYAVPICEQNKPLLVERFACNGEHSHWDLINSTTGDVLWTQETQ